MGETNGWHLKPIISVGMIGALFAMGVAWGVNRFQVAAQAEELKTHKGLPMHPQAGERMIELETHMVYFRKDVSDIKDIVKDLSRKFDRVQREMPIVGPIIR